MLQRTPEASYAEATEVELEDKALAVNTIINNSCVRGGREEAQEAGRAFWASKRTLIICEAKQF